MVLDVFDFQCFLTFDTIPCRKAEWQLKRFLAIFLNDDSGQATYPTPRSKMRLSTLLIRDQAEYKKAFLAQTGEAPAKQFTKSSSTGTLGASGVEENGQGPGKLAPRSRLSAINHPHHRQIPQKLSYLRPRSRS